MYALDATGRGGKANLAVLTQQALLVLVVLDGHLGDDALGNLVEGLTVVLDTQTEGLDELVLVGPLGEALRMQVLAQAIGELHVGGQATAIDGLVHEASGNRAGRIVREDGALALGDGGDGQEDVAGRLDGGVHEQVDADAELEGLAQGVMPALGLHRGVR